MLGTAEVWVCLEPKCAFLLPKLAAEHSVATNQKLQLVVTHSEESLETKMQWTCINVFVLTLVPQCDFSGFEAVKVLLRGRENVN